MITCKEDLINTYIENDHGELRHLYIKKAIEMGFAHPNYKDREVDWYDLGYIGICTGWGDDMLGQTDHDNGSLKDHECRKLTLSDLKPTKQYAVLHKGGSYSFQSDKPIGNDVVACFDLAHSEKPLSEDFFDGKPRTKVEYEKVTESIFDLKDEFYSGSLFSLNSYDNYMSIDTLSELVDSINNGNIYRKVERPVEWWEDAVEHLSSNCKGVTAAGYCKDTNSIAITGHMNQEQCYDFARILLEQEGE